MSKVQPSAELVDCGSMKRYLASVGLAMLLVISGIVSFNYFVDPLGLFHFRDADVATLNRIELFDRMRLQKPLHVNRVKPDRVIIGSSRSGTLQPPRQDRQVLNAYNFSMPGLTIYELNRSVKHAHANRPLTRLTIGLDYDALVSPKPVYRPGFEPNRMAQSSFDFSSPAHIFQNLRDLQATLFSFDMLASSKSALAPSPSTARQYRADGSWKSITNKLTGRGGYIFVAKNVWDANKDTLMGSDENIKILHDLLDFCYRNSIDTKLFFTPAHVLFVDLWFHKATQELWRSTHKKVINMNESIAKAHGMPAYEIWSFGAEAQAVTEPIYLARHTPKAWFNDGIHYRPKMAKKIMSALWGPEKNFGEVLSSATNDDYLDRVDRLRQQFLDGNQQLVARIQKQIGIEP